MTPVCRAEGTVKSAFVVQIHVTVVFMNPFSYNIRTGCCRSRVHKKGDTAMESMELIETFKRFVTSAMQYAIKSHDTLFKEECDISISLTYLNASISRFSSAEALYYAQYDILQREEAEELFYQFKVYANEFLTNVETDHSHQWTDIEFSKLHDIFDSSAFAFENLT